MNKRKSKRLTLAGETIRNLNTADLEQAAGGAETDKCTRACTRFDCTYTYACSGCTPCA